MITRSAGNVLRRIVPALALLWSAALLAQDAPATVEPFVRAKAPADRMRDWPLGDARYLPVPAAEFERLVEAARQSAAQQSPRKLAHIELAEYEARFDGLALRDGKASLQFAHHASDDVFLPLSPCGIAIRDPIWRTDPNGPALLGTTHEGIVGVMVPDAATLEFRWSLGGRAEPGGRIALPLDLPRGSATRLTFDAPDNVTPQLTAGSIQEATSSEEGTRRWVIELPPSSGEVLRLISAAPNGGPSAHPAVRQLSTYDLAPRGLELSVRFDLSVGSQPLDRLELELDAGLKLVDARSQDKRLSWSPDSERGPGRIRVLLDPPIEKGSRAVTVRALGSFPRDELKRLPALRVANAAWQEGTAVVRVMRPLVLKDLSLEDCRQSKVGSLPSRQPGETIEVQFFEPDAAISLSVSHRPAVLQISTGRQIEIGPTDLTCLTSLHIESPEGQRFAFEAVVPRPWQLESVSSEPADAIDHWNLEDVKDGDPILHVHLARAFGPASPLELRLRGRRTPLITEAPLRAADLRMIRVDASALNRSIAAVRSSSGYELKMRGTGEFSMLDPDKLDSTDQGLFAEPPAGIVFVDNPQAALLELVVDRQKPRFAADIRVTATVSNDQLQEEYLLRCVPEGTSMDRILVEFRPPRDEPLTWTQPEGGRLAALRLSPDELDRNESPETETWEVRLPRAVNGPIELNALRVSAFEGAPEVCLAALPEAREQTGRVRVCSSDSTDIGFENLLLDPLPLDPTVEGRGVSVRGTFAYEPAHEMDRTGGPALTLVQGSNLAKQHNLLVWNCRVESRLQPDGAAEHTAIYSIQNFGRPAIELQLPQGAQLENAWLDDVRISRPLVDQRLNVPLPAAPRFLTLTASYVTRHEPFGVTGRIRNPVPVSDAPVMAQQWIAWLPPEYEAQHSGWTILDGGAPARFSWMQRLFGPLGRAADERPFNPLSVDDWAGLALPTADRHAALAKARRVVELIGSTSEAEGSNRSGQVATWGQLMTFVGDSMGSDGVPWFVNRQALADAGIDATTPVERTRSGSPFESGAAQLQQAGLVLVVHPRALLLSSTSATARQTWGMQTVHRGALYEITSGQVADELLQAADGASNASLVSATGWNQQDHTPWKRRTAAVHRADTLGWSAFRWNDDRPQPAELLIVRRDAMQGLGWLAFLLVASWLTWRAPQRMSPLVLCAGFFAALALVVPDTFVIVIAGALMGILVSLIARLAGLERRATKPTPAQILRGPRFSLKAGLPLIALGAGLSIAVASAQPLAPAEPAALASVHRVFIPVDANQQPTGEPYLVPESLYMQLRRTEGLAAGRPEGWLVEGAQYHGTLDWQGNPPRLNVMHLSGLFDVQVFAPGTHLQLPLPKESAELVADRVTLDGHPVPSTYDPSRELVDILIPQPGRYRLELRWRPKLVPQGSTNGFDLPILPVSVATLELTLPARAPQVMVPSALGCTTRTDDARRMSVELGCTRNLAVRWSEGSVGASTGIVDVDELGWLKVQSGSVVLNSRMTFSVVEGTVSQLRLAADPRLQLLPDQDETGPLIRVNPGNPQDVVVDLPQPANGTIVLDTSWLLLNASGIGKLTLPHLEAVGARTTKRWLGVSVDHSLSYTETTDAPTDAVPAAEFADAWEIAPSKIDFAYRLPLGPWSWTLATRPRDPLRAAEQTIAISFAQGQSEVRFAAAIVTSGGYCFRYGLHVPNSMTVRKVSVLEDNTEQSTHWSLSAPGVLNIFLKGPVAGRQELLVEGSIPTPQHESVELQPFTIDDCQVVSNQLQLYRRPTVRVQVADHQGLAEVKPSADLRLSPNMGRLVKCYDVEGEPYRAVFTLEANQPDVSGTQITSLEREGNTWQAAVSLTMDVQDGQLDELRFEIPPEWSGPFEIEPPMRSRVVPVPGSARNQLILQPDLAIEGPLGVVVRGPVTIPGGQRVEVPQVAALDVQLSEHFLVLPVQSGLQQVAWETRGVLPSPLPPQFAAPPVAPESFVAYRVFRDDFDATMHAVGQVAAEPQIRFADIRLAWHENDRYQAVATFDLEPAGLTECELTLPKGTELLELLIDGQTATATVISPLSWRVRLGPANLPQRVSIVYQGRVNHSGIWGDRTFTAPSLGDLPTNRTLWTVLSPPKTESTVPLNATQLSSQAAALQRAQQAIVMTDVPPDSITDSRAEEVNHWYEGWGHRGSITLAAVQRSVTNSADPAQRLRIEADLARLRKERDDITARLLTPESVKLWQSKVVEASQPQEVWDLMIDRGRPAKHYESTLGQSTLTLRQPRPWQSGRFSLLLAAAGVILLVLLANTASNRGMLWQWAHHWPYAVGIAVGLFWCAFLRFSLVGWAIVLVSLYFALRPAGRPLREAGSTIVKTSTAR